MKDTQYFQSENSMLRTTINTLQKENTDLLRSKTDDYETMRKINQTHRTVLDEQDVKEREIASLQTTVERLREEHRQINSQNQTYLESISALKEIIQELRATTNRPPDSQQTSSDAQPCQKYIHKREA